MSDLQLIAKKSQSNYGDEFGGQGTLDPYPVKVVLPACQSALQEFIH